MKKVFISWGKPDQGNVELLKVALEGAQIEYDEYTHFMEAGDQIHEAVLSKIREASIAVICLSNETAVRDWVVREIDWCFDALTADDRPLERLVPIKIGPLDNNNVPRLIQESAIHVADVYHDGQLHTGLERLVIQLRTALHLGPSHVIPATIFAMNSKQYKKLAHDHVTWDSLRALCGRFGMRWNHQLPQELSDRYGNQPADFKPFEQSESLIQLISNSLNMINQRRTGKPPIFVRWYTPSELLQSGAVTNPKWQHWNVNKRIFVVDSVSMLHPEIRDQLVTLLDISEQLIDLQAVLWIPPYTRHTSAIQHNIQQVAGQHFKLEIAYSNWADKPHCHNSFDIASRPGLMHWVSYAVGHLAAAKEAQVQREERMQQAFPGPSAAPRIRG